MAMILSLPEDSLFVTFLVTPLGLSVLQVYIENSAKWVFTTDQYVVKENCDSLACQGWFTRDYALWSRANQMIKSL
ncbi:hypothetical protein T440DRAFT_466518 [Plenodomus tracheiphilus IPT5]|uniref:Uncharacterized protein n=1 Tax=Plenodomus tracheiphilus IPT5 TaxID=1408161 RepID=A0A6A7BBN9_9PLEO|nr:hypothetical protein T440DRAFT_466518 [Plenodomus tracheiphilus IPT5]